jgi:hypothetical protein
MKKKNCKSKSAQPAYIWQNNYVLFQYDRKTSPADNKFIKRQLNDVSNKHFTKCVIHFISVGSDFLCKTISLER